MPRPSIIRSADQQGQDLEEAASVRRRSQPVSVDQVVSANQLLAVLASDSHRASANLQPRQRDLGRHLNLSRRLGGLLKPQDLAPQDLAPRDLVKLHRRTLLQPLLRRLVSDRRQQKIHFLPPLLRVALGRDHKLRLLSVKAHS
jgi:hypothetical protein